MSRTRTSPAEIAAQARQALRSMELAIRKARFDRVGTTGADSDTATRARQLSAADTAHLWRKAG